MATIRKHGERWQVQVRRKGYRPLSKSFRSRRDAELWARDTERRMDLGHAIERPDPVQSQLRIADLLNRYAEEVSPHKAGGDIEQIRLSSMVREPWAALTVRELDSAQLASWRDRRLRQVSPGTFLREFGLLRRVLACARNEWSVPARVDVFDRIRRPTAPPGRARRLKAEELELLQASLKKSRNPYVRPAVMLALETGMRRGELLALRWSDVDLDRGHVILRTSKNGHGRIVPLTPAAKTVLTGIRRDGSERVFPVTPGALQQAFGHAVARTHRIARERALKAPKGSRKSFQGIQDLHFHDLRHEAISRFLERGLTVIEAAEISGHRTLSMVRRYAHADLARVRQLFAAAPPNSSPR